MKLEIIVLGMVQGVGYRPFVRTQAEKIGLDGLVRNRGGFVHIFASGDEPDLLAFLETLKTMSPPGAHIHDIRVRVREDNLALPKGFSIAPSSESSLFLPILPADIAICEQCAAELTSAEDRRYEYPFISCASCGPRYSIFRDIPYDRENIAMSVFEMCPSCRMEYTEEGRRCHAQTISCHDCGPRLSLITIGDRLADRGAYDEAVRYLADGRILSVKGIGGYQLVCRADRPETVDALRRLKRRDRKPFAVMFSAIEEIREICEVSDKESELLESPMRPIVILRPRRHAFSKSVVADSRFLGAFLPSTGLHQMLTSDVGPLVVTSHNLSDDPILYRDEDIPAPSEDSYAAVLTHNRAIDVPLDDSVVRVICGRVQILRRSRGYVPTPVYLHKELPVAVFAAGGDLKSSFCFASGEFCYPSTSFGDLESLASQTNYAREYERMSRLLGVKPAILAKDLHPDYFAGELLARLTGSSGEPIREPEVEGGVDLPEESAADDSMTDEVMSDDILPTTVAAENTDAAATAEEPSVETPAIPVIGVQHHHAHIASVMAEHNLSSCIGVAFDGTGYGTDGNVWGGEFFHADGVLFTREAYLSNVRIVAGDDILRRPDTIAYCYLAATGEDMRHEDSDLLRAALRNKTLTFKTSSMGRLFDAISAVLEICECSTFEGEAAILLENAAAEAVACEVAPFSLHFAKARDKDEGMPDAAAIVRDIRYAYLAGIDRRALALAFHAAIAETIALECDKIRGKYDESRVALSGGVFANVLLTELTVAALEKQNFTVYMNEAVPCNDGGLALGQAYIASHLAKGV